MIDHQQALETVIRHAVELEDDYEDIAPHVAALAASGDATLVPRLEDALREFLDEGNFYGRDLIAAVLAGIQGVAALPVLLHASARDLGDDQDGLQTEIIDLIHADPNAARRTALELAGHDEADLRLTGLWALGFAEEPSDVEVLAAAAKDRDPRVRSTAIGAIPDPAGNEHAFLVVVSALSDVDERVRVSAADRLGYTKRADAVAPLVGLASDPSPRVRSIVVDALGRLGNAGATPALRQLLQDAQPQVRERAIQALGRVADPAAVDALLGLAATQDPRLRVHAAKALASAAEQDRRAAAQINVLARDADATVRAATLSGLASASTRMNWAPLVLELADDPDPTVRQRVAVVARHLAPDTAASILERFAGDPDQTVRRAATAALNRLTGTAGR
jgi:HEAT repeat protein